MIIEQKQLKNIRAQKSQFSDEFEQNSSNNLKNSKNNKKKTRFKEKENNTPIKIAPIIDGIELAKAQKRGHAPTHSKHILTPTQHRETLNQDD